MFYSSVIIKMINAENLYSVEETIDASDRYRYRLPL